MIDPNTQSVVVFIGVRGKGLREGMYLKGKLKTSAVNNAMSLPLDLLVNQNQVYTVVDNTLRLQKVDVLKTNTSSAIVQGIPDETLLVKEKLIGAFEGMQVKAVKLTASN